MRRIVFALVLIVLAGVATSASAQAKAGASEIGFSGAFVMATEGDDDGTLIANFRYGYFTTDALEIGAGLTVGGPVDDLDAATTAELFVSYHFNPASTHTWYARGGYFTSLKDTDQGAIDLAVGFKSYFRENAAFFWEAGYGQFVNSDFDGGTVRSVAGIGFFF